jgi:ankyrin repeat protein
MFLLYAFLLTRVGGVAAGSGAPPADGITLYTPVEIPVPAREGGAAPLTVMVPSTAGERRLSTPAALHDSVALAYKAVLEKQQSGLVDAKTPWLMDAPLHPKETWHHAEAAKAGVLDSARFLITFSMVPSVQTGGTPLHVAAALGAAEAVEALLAEGAAVDAEREADGHTPLHHAAAMGHAEVVRVLLRAGADVERAGKSGARPLMVAAAFGHAPVVAALLAGGADPRAAHPFAGTTALHFASEMGRAEVIAALCAAGARADARTVAGGQPLHTAADTNQSVSVAALLAPGCAADPNALLNGDTTPLYLAAQRGLTGVVRALAVAGADLDYVMPRGKFKGAMVPFDDDGADSGPIPEGAFYSDKNTKIGNGATALHAAVENGHLDTARALVALGAEQQNSMEGASPLLIALQYRHPLIALALLRERPKGRGAHVNTATPHDGARPLSTAVMYGFAEVVGELLRQGADAAAADKAGRTALSVALGAGNTALAQLLIAAGGLHGHGGGSDAGRAALAAAVDTRRGDLLALVLSAGGGRYVNASGGAGDGMPPLHRAAKGGWVAGVRALLAAGADAGAGAGEGGATTPLHLAAMGGHAAVVAELGARGAPLGGAGDRSHGGFTPLHLAARSGSEATVAALLALGADGGARARGTQEAPLHLAAEGGYEGAARALLAAAPASAGAVDRAGRTPFFAAAMANREALLALLAGAPGGGGVDAPDNRRRSALQACLAYASCRPSTAKALLKLGATLGACDGGGAGLLDAAVAGDRRAADKAFLVKFLIGEAGLDPRGGCSGGGGGARPPPPLLLAVEAGATEVVAELVQGGAALRGGVGARALVAAVKKGLFEMAVELLAAGADPEEAAEGTSPLDAARDARAPDLIKLLSAAAGKRAAARA